MAHEFIDRVPRVFPAKYESETSNLKNALSEVEPLYLDVVDAVEQNANVNDPRQTSTNLDASMDGLMASLERLVGEMKKGGDWTDPRLRPQNR